MRTRISQSDKQRYYRYAAVLMAVLFLLSVGFLGLTLWENSQPEFPEVDVDPSHITYNGKEYQLRSDVESFLVLGLDTLESDKDPDAYNNNMQSDFLMLFVFDNNTKTYTALHINRDTMTKINILGVAGNTVDTVTQQIALAHTYGNGREVSCRNASDAVSYLLNGIRVSHYASFTMEAVPILNDLVDGVEVVVSDDFTGIDNALVKGETVTLRGEQALTYVRSRAGMEDPSNLARMERQRQYLSALQKKAAEYAKNDDQFVINSSLKVADYIVSDRTVNQLQEIFRKITEYEFTGIQEMQGTSKVGERFMEFYPDEDALQETIIRLFYQEKH